MQINLISCSTPVHWHDRLLHALNILSEKRSPYRVPVVDKKFSIEGVISGRRILEILIGRRGEALKRKEGTRSIFQEHVGLFLDEVYNVFSDSTDLNVLIQYMAENTLGYVFIVDQRNIFKGVIDDTSILKQLKGKVFNLKVDEIMCSKIYSVTPKTTLHETSKIMINRSIRRIPIAENRILKGIITTTDILNHLLAYEKRIDLTFQDMDLANALAVEVQDIMSKPLSIEPWQDVGKAIDKIVYNEVSGLPVASSEGELSGIITRLDLVTKLVKAKGVSNLINMMGGSI